MTRHIFYINATIPRDINLNTANAAHPLQNRRLNNSQIQMDPQKAITYNNAIANKQVMYPTFVTNNYSAYCTLF